MLGQSPQQSLHMEPCGTRTPASGTPEWSPRQTCVDQAPQTLNPLSGLESVPFGPQIAGDMGSQACTPSGAEHAPQALQMWAGQELSPEHAPQETQTWEQPVWHGDMTGHSHTWYRVAYLGGIELRLQPSFLAARTGVVLIQNEVFAVSAEVVGADSRVYLRLADGRGWAFDDSALLPHDPSVVRGYFAPAGHEPSQGLATLPCLQPEQVMAPDAASPLQAHFAGSVPIQATSPYSYPGPGLPAEAAPPLHAHVTGSMASSVTPSCHYLEQVPQLDPASPVHTHIAVSTVHPVAMSCSPQADDATLAWASMNDCRTIQYHSVTSDSPPTWEPSVALPAAQPWESRHWTY